MCTVISVRKFVINVILACEISSKVKVTDFHLHSWRKEIRMMGSPWLMCFLCFHTHFYHKKIILSIATHDCNAHLKMRGNLRDFYVNFFLLVYWLFTIHNHLFPFFFCTFTRNQAWSSKLQQHSVYLNSIQQQMGKVVICSSLQLK